MSTPPTTQAPINRALTTSKVFVGTFMTALFIMGVAVAFILPAEMPEDVWVWGVLIVVTATCAFLAWTSGLRVPAIPAGTSREGAQVGAGQAVYTSTMRRAAFCEAPAIVSLALAFVSFSGLVYFAGAAISLLLLSGLAWPSGPVLWKLESQLDADGVRSGLSSSGR